MLHRVCILFVLILSGDVVRQTVCLSSDIDQKRTSEQNLRISVAQSLDAGKHRSAQLYTQSNVCRRLFAYLSLKIDKKK